jgi:hypothetical protein
MLYPDDTRGQYLVKWTRLLRCKPLQALYVVREEDAASSPEETTLEQYEE